MAVMERPSMWSLWAEDKEAKSCIMLDSSQDRESLVRQAKGIQSLFPNKTFHIVQGTNCPKS
jgi:beta-lactamase class D